MTVFNYQNTLPNQQLIFEQDTGDLVGLKNPHANGADMNLGASTGSAIINYTQAGTGAVTRTVQSRLRDKVSVKDYGAVGDGATDDTAAIASAATYAGSIGANLFFPAGDYLTSATVEVIMDMGLMMNAGAWLIPTANVNVIKGYAGSIICANVDTSGNASWNAVCLDYEAISQLGPDSDLSFQLNTQTFFDVKLKGAKTGTSKGTAIKMHADVDSNGGVAGVIGQFWTDGFDDCLWLVNNIADGTRWVNGNVIHGFCNFPVRALRMDDVSTFGGGMAGNIINIQCETRPLSTTTALFELAGQNNNFQIMPWDFDGGASGLVPAIIFTTTFSASSLRTFCDPAFITFTNLGNTCKYENYFGGADGFHVFAVSAIPGQNLVLQSDETSSNLGLSVPNATGAITFTLNSVQRLSLANNGNLFFRGAAASGGITIRNFNTTGTVDLPTIASSDVLVAEATAQTLTNKTLTLPKVTATIVGSLGAATAGLRATVTDGSVVAAGNFGTVVAGGGANVVPVYADGTDWRIG